MSRRRNLVVLIAFLAMGLVTTAEERDAAPPPGESWDQPGEAARFFALQGDRERLVDGHGPPGEPLGEILSGGELHDEEVADGGRLTVAGTHVAVGATRYH